MEKTKLRNFGVRLPDSTWERVRITASEMNLSANSLLILAIEPGINAVKQALKKTTEQPQHEVT